MKIIRLTILFILFVLTSCTSIRQTVTYEKVTNGIDLEKIDLISFDSFFNQWVHNRRIQKIDLNIKELNKDNQFTYFGKPKHGLTKINWTYFKIHTDTLTLRLPNYNEFYGTELSDYLWTNVIPKEDIELWNKNREIQRNRMKPNCPFKKNKPVQNFSLTGNKVRIIMTWEIECSELGSLKSRTYIAYYNLLTKEYEKE